MNSYQRARFGKNQFSEEQIKPMDKYMKTFFLQVEGYVVGCLSLINLYEMSFTLPSQRALRGYQLASNQPKQHTLKAIDYMITNRINTGLENLQIND